MLEVFPLPSLFENNKDKLNILIKFLGVLCSVFEVLWTQRIERIEDIVITKILPFVIFLLFPVSSGISIYKANTQTQKIPLWKYCTKENIIFFAESISYGYKAVLVTCSLDHHIAESHHHIVESLPVITYAMKYIVSHCAIRKEIYFHTLNRNRATTINNKQRMEWWETREKLDICSVLNYGKN